MPSTASSSGRSDTGSWLMPYSWRTSIAAPTRSVVRASTTGGRSGSCGRARSSSSMRTTPAGRREQAVGPHPLVVVELRQVVPAAVREDHDHDGLARGGATLAHDPARLVERGDDRRAARFAGEDALLPRDPPRHRKRVAVRDAHPAVDHLRVVRARKEVLADALGQVRAGRVAGQDGALRVRARPRRCPASASAGSARCRSPSRRSRRWRRGGVSRPSVWAQISGPVVSSWAVGFSWFQYWSGLNAPGMSRASRAATE